jgi:hypothetical protein
MPKSLCPTLFVTALVICSSATASVITVDPANFASGTDISDVFEGVALSTLTIPAYTDDFSWPDNVPPLVQSAVYAIDCTPCAESTNGQTVFSPRATFDNGSFYPAFNFSDKVARQLTQESGPQMPTSEALAVNFDNATDYVEVIGGGAANSNFFRLDIWNLAGDLIGTCSSGASNSAGCTATQLGSSPVDSAWSKDQWSLSFQSALSDIAFITTGGWAGGQYVRSVAYNSAAVPEPTPALLISAGLLSLLISKRKRPASRMSMTA